MRDWWSGSSLNEVRGKPGRLEAWEGVAAPLRRTPRALEPVKVGAAGWTGGGAVDYNRESPSRSLDGLSGLRECLVCTKDSASDGSCEQCGDGVTRELNNVGLVRREQRSRRAGTA